MTDRTQLSDQTDTDYLLGMARFFILAAISRLQDAMAGCDWQTLPARIARQLIRYTLHPAEVALRRAILIIAAELTLPPPHPKSQRSSDKTAPRLTAQSRKPRRPVFRLTEPEPRASGTAPPFLPRITLLDDAALAARSVPMPAPSAPDLTAQLVSRLVALEHAAENPLQQAKRWLRRQERQRASGKPLPRLSFLHIPGLSPRLSEEDTQLIKDLNTAAFRAGLPMPNTS